MKTGHTELLHFTFSSLLSVSRVSMVLAWQFMNQYWYIIFNWIPFFIQIVFIFTNIHFFGPGSHSGHHVAFGCPIALGFSWLWYFSNFPPFLMTLIDFRSTGHILCKMSLTWELSDFFFPCLDRSKEFCWRRIQRYSLPLSLQLLSVQLVEGTFYQCDLSLWMWTLNTLPKVVLVRFFRFKVTLLPFAFPHCLLWKEVNIYNLHLRGGSYGLPPCSLRLESP